MLPVRLVEPRASDSLKQASPTLQSCQTHCAAENFGPLPSLRHKADEPEPAAAVADAPNTDMAFGSSVS
jgi:hypothetical protein